MWLWQRLELQTRNPKKTQVGSVNFFGRILPSSENIN
jgi:hypothetical protein